MLSQRPLRHATLLQRCMRARVSGMPRMYATEAPVPPHTRRTFGQWLWSWRLVRYPVYGTGFVVVSAGTIFFSLYALDLYKYHNVDTMQPSLPDFADCKRGGPGHRPILPSQTNETLDNGKPRKERLVIVGGGWGAVSLLNKLDPELYDVTVVSPVNYFLFTPLLPAVAGGTVHATSVIEPLRRILEKHGARYVQGAACNVHQRKDLDMKTDRITNYANGLLEVEAISETWDGQKEPNHVVNKDMVVHIPYDKLVVAVGCVSNEYGAKGVEHAHRLKCIEDALGLRKHVLENFERASLPSLDPEERRRLLSFVVCGGGPTGVEVAAEIFDLINEDIPKCFPGDLAQQASVNLLEYDPHILNTYSERISVYAEEHFRREAVNVITSACVNNITPTSVSYVTKNPLTDETVTHTVPSGCTVWTTGIKMNPFTALLSKALPHQGHRHALKVDMQLRVLGAEPGTMYAVGDASTVDRDVPGYVEHNLHKFDSDHDGKLTVPEFENLIHVLSKKFPIAKQQVHQVQDELKKHSYSSDHLMSADEIASYVERITRHLMAFPPTAQTASQEGKYLAQKLNKYGKLRAKNELPDVSPTDLDDAVYHPFQYHNLGSLAYLGNAAAFDLPLPAPFGQFVGGFLAMYAWRGVYLSELVSLRSRMLVACDYVNRSLFGRNVSWL